MLGDLRTVSTAVSSSMSDVPVREGERPREPKDWGKGNESGLARTLAFPVMDWIRGLDAAPDRQIAGQLPVVSQRRSMAH